MNFIKYFSLALAAVIISTFISAGAAVAWTGPTASPPNANTAAPLNTGSTAQTKSGNLTSSQLCLSGSCISAWPASISSLSWGNITGKPFNWAGQGGQPTWLWGSNDGSNYYVWNPANFNVNYANTAGTANNANAFGGVGTGSFRQFNVWQNSHYSGTDGTEYAAVFYDTNNGGYYLNPDGGSRLNYVSIVGNLTFDSAIPHERSGYYLCIPAWNQAVTYGENCSSSDGRLKTNVVTIASSTALSQVLALRPVTFNWKDNQSNDPESLNATTTNIGLIAQEVLPIIPEVISKNSDGYYALDYAKLTPVIVGAVQEQEQKIKTLQQEVDTLKAEVDALRAAK